MRIRRMLRHLTLSLTLAATAHAVTFHVAPDGESLVAARDAIRKLKAQGPLREAVRVEIADGVYPITGALVFEPQDGGTAEFPITYAASPGARPLISGGRKIAGFTVGADGVWTAHVDPAWKFEALWVNGERATRARTPNAGYFEATGAPAAALDGVKLNGPLGSSAINVAPNVAAEFANLSEDERRDANVIVYHSWQDITPSSRGRGCRCGDAAIHRAGTVEFLHARAVSSAAFRELPRRSRRARRMVPGTRRHSLLSAASGRETGDRGGDRASGRAMAGVARRRG
jgi:hypothetical protein